MKSCVFVTSVHVLARGARFAILIRRKSQLEFNGGTRSLPLSGARPQSVLEMSKEISGMSFRVSRRGIIALSPIGFEPTARCAMAPPAEVARNDATSLTSAGLRFFSLKSKY